MSKHSPVPTPKIKIIRGFIQGLQGLRGLQNSMSYDTAMSDRK